MQYLNGSAVLTTVNRIVNVTKDCNAVPFVWNTADTTVNVQIGSSATITVSLLMENDVSGASWSDYCGNADTFALTGWVPNSAPYWNMVTNGG